MKISQIVFIVLFAIFGFFILSRLKRNCPPLTANSETLVVGTSADFSPFSFMKEGEIVGFDIDIAKEVADRLNKNIEIVNRSFDMLIPELQLGRIEMIAAGMTATPERSERVLFTEPYISKTPLVAITLKNNPAISSFENLKGKNIIVNTGYTADLQLSKFPDINIKRLPTISDALLALNSGQGDAFVTAENTIKSFLKTKAGENYNVYQLEGLEENTALAIAKNKPELLTQVQKALNEMQADGTIEKLKKKWGLDD